MSTVVVSPVVVVDTSSANPQIVQQSAGTIGVGVSVVVV